MARELPCTFGEYELLRSIGRGGMAEVFEARVLEEHRRAGLPNEAAVKIMLPQLAADGEFRNMFHDEVMLASALDHPNVVRVFDSGLVAGERGLAEPFLAMELVDGMGLDRLLTTLARRGEVLPVAAALSVARCVASGLHHAHTQKAADGRALGIVHRDVSPQNILLGRLGQVKLSDFGVAKAVDRVSHTQTGVLKGKLGYMAPEQAEEFDVDARADQFALGIVLWEMLCARRLFKGENPVAAISLVVACEVTPPSKLRPEIPPSVDRVVMRALSRWPDQRFKDLEEMNQALDRAFDDLEHKPEDDLRLWVLRGLEAPMASPVPLAAGGHIPVQTDADPDADTVAAAPKTPASELAEPPYRAPTATQAPPGAPMAAPNALGQFQRLAIDADAQAPLTSTGLLVGLGVGGLLLLVTIVGFFWIAASSNEPIVVVGHPAGATPRPSPKPGPSTPAPVPTPSQKPEQPDVDPLREVITEIAPEAIRGRTGDHAGLGWRSFALTSRHPPSLVLGRLGSKLNDHKLPFELENGANTGVLNLGAQTTAGLDAAFVLAHRPPAKEGRSTSGKTAAWIVVVEDRTGAGSSALRQSKVRSLAEGLDELLDRGQHWSFTPVRVGRTVAEVDTAMSNAVTATEQRLVRAGFVVRKHVLEAAHGGPFARGLRLRATSPSQAVVVDFAAGTEDQTLLRGLSFALTSAARVEDRARLERTRVDEAADKLVAGASEEAIARADLALGLSSIDGDAHLIRGAAAEQLGRLDEAAKGYQQFLFWASTGSVNKDPARSKRLTGRLRAAVQRNDLVGARLAYKLKVLTGRCAEKVTCTEEMLLRYKAELRPDQLRGFRAEVEHCFRRCRKPALKPSYP